MGVCVWIARTNSPFLIPRSLSLHDVRLQELCDFLGVRDLLGVFLARGGEGAVGFEVLAHVGAGGAEGGEVAC